jgi:hypothetical protein
MIHIYIYIYIYIYIPKILSKDIPTAKKQLTLLVLLLKKMSRNYCLKSKRYHAIRQSIYQIISYFEKKKSRNYCSEKQNVFIRRTWFAAKVVTKLLIKKVGTIWHRSLYNLIFYYYLLKLI